MILFSILICVICFPLSDVYASDSNIGKHLARMQRKWSMVNKGDATTEAWMRDPQTLCQKIKTLLSKKKAILARLEVLNKSVILNENELNNEERNFQLETFEIVKDEFNESEHLVYQALVALEYSMQGDWQNILNIKESSKARLDALRDATLKEEQEYNAILVAEKHQQHILVARLASSTSLLLMLLMTCVGILAGYLFGMSVSASGFIAACLSLSSTPLVVKYLSAPPPLAASGEHPRPVHHTTGRKTALSPPPPPHPTSTQHHSAAAASINMERAYWSSNDTSVHVDHTGVRPAAGSASSVSGPDLLLGVLVMQDLLLGGLVAVLPLIARHNTPPPDTSPQHAMPLPLLLRYGKLLAKLAASLLGVVLVASVTSKYVIERLFRWLESLRSKELLTISSLAVAFSMLLLTDYLHISMEVGCFIAGVMLTNQSRASIDIIQRCLQPIRDFCALLFFASIGLHVFPTFVAIQLSTLVTLTILVVSGKFLISVSILHLLLPAHMSSLKYLVSIGLAQVSEFSFVLASRARRLQLIGREVYLLMLSVTTLSLALSPILWKVFTSGRAARPAAAAGKRKVKSKMKSNSGGGGYDDPAAADGVLN